MGTLERKREVEEEWKSISISNSPPHFPPHFLFGVATSAYQVEGACNEGGRGPSIWDAFSHAEGTLFDTLSHGLMNFSGNTCDGTNGDIAVDQYHRYKEDIDLIAKLRFSAYRFSISWSRIFPDGLGGKMNDEGIAHYNNVINALLEKGIEPYVTLYHWDLPLHLHDSMGGWVNESIVKYFAIFAETCFASFGDRVKNWITINEPLQTAVNGYCTGIYAPGRRERASTEPYLVAHHQLLAHAEAVSIYREKFKAENQQWRLNSTWFHFYCFLIFITHVEHKDKQGGQIGLVVDCEWAEPLTDRIEDQRAAARRLDFQLGWYLDPIFFGDYPQSMHEKLGARLPKFLQKDKELLRNSVDFVGLNHYSSRFVTHATVSHEGNDFYREQEVERIAEWEGGEVMGDKAASPWLYVVPWGIRKVLNYIAHRYNNPPIYVTENGMDDEDDDVSPLHEMLDDELRVRYFKGYLAAVAQAIKDGTNVRGYFAWSLMDNFEWQHGYTKRFGLIYVDFKNGLSRHLKSSAYWFLRFLIGGKEGKNGKEE